MPRQALQESEETVALVAATTGLDGDYITDVLHDTHHVIDSLCADNVNVLLGPLYLIRRDNPVVPALVQHFTSADWQASEGLKTAPPEDLARALHLPVEVVRAHPCAFGTHVLHAVTDHRQVPEDDNDEFCRLDSVIWAWRGRMTAAGVGYRVSTAGLERDFETWLIRNLDRLTDLDIYVEQVAHQPRLAGGAKRPDLVCRFTKPTANSREGDLLVIENKSTPVGIAAWHQLDEYADLVKAEMAANGERVVAMLIADGTTVELQDALDGSAIYASLTALGYRDHLYLQQGLTRVIDADPTTDISNAAPAILDLPDTPR